MRFVGLAILLLAASCARAGFTPPDQRREAFAPGDRGLERRGDLPLDASPDLGPCPYGCWIEEACRTTGAVNGSDTCKVCDPSFSAWAWGPAKGCVITVAGGSAGYADGPALSARFNAPEEIALDGEGRLYVADANNHRIRVVHRGQVTTLAGAGTVGWADGPAASALFNYPHGIAVAGGVVYVAEINGRRIRKIANGAVATFAGDGTAGYLDGPALSARFGSVYSLALAGSRLYLTDLVGSRVRWIEGGVVSTLAGDGTHGYLDAAALSAKFDGLYGIAVDGAGRVLVAEQSPGNRIRMIDGGLVSTLVGTAGVGWLDGPVSSAKLDNANGLAIGGGGRLYVADCGNARIRMVYQDQVSTIAGDGVTGFADGPVKSARFTCPTGIAIDSGGRLYVGDTNNDRIRAINP
jgi:DNA-binding beta-propeller fold protein YncE